MTHKVKFETEAVAQLLELARTEPKQARRVFVAIRTFAATGHGDIKKLEGGPPTWRLRVGDWRVFLTDPSQEVIDVLSVMNRRDAYQ
ncbi:MAG: type II toxin-antitoxin system RelE/ParE family toxin [Dehalococcoidia bacterium]